MGIVILVEANKNIQYFVIAADCNSAIKYDSGTEQNKL